MSDTSVNINGRNHDVDAMKGVAMMLVIIGHSFIAGYYGINKIIFSFHMPFFFILAGYFACATSYHQVLNKSYHRLIVPYLLSAFIVVLIALGYGDIELAKGKLLAILFPRGFHSQLNGYQLNVVVGATWFLLALFWARLIFNILLNIISRINHYRLIYLTVLSVAISTGSIYLANRLTLLPFGILEGSQAIVYMAIGYVLNKEITPPNIQQRLYNDVTQSIVLLASFVIWVIAILYSEIDMAPIHYRNYFLALLGALSGSYILYKFILLLSLFSKLSLLYNCIETIGRHSLLALCVHNVILSYCAIGSMWGYKKGYTAFALNVLMVFLIVYAYEGVHIINKKLIGKKLNDQYNK